MVRVNFNATKVLALAGIGLTLCGCTAFRQALGTAKNPPDEFTVLTKAPLVIPPDFNLRPPQPGAAARNEPDPDIQAREALFPQNAAAQAAALGTQYSEGERFLLTRTNALAVDANVRRRVTADAGQEDLGPEFAQRLLNQPAGTPAQPAQAQAVVPPAQPAPVPAAVPPAQPAPVPAAVPPVPPVQVQAAVPPAQPVQVPAAAPPAPPVEIQAAAPPVPAEPAAAPSIEPPAVPADAPAQPAVELASINPSSARALPPPVAASAAAPPAGLFVLEIGAHRTEQSAYSALRALNRRSQTLSQLEQGVQIVDLGAEGTLYRLQAGRFADGPSAASACEALKSERVDCVVTDPSQAAVPSIQPPAVRAEAPAQPAVELASIDRSPERALPPPAAASAPAPLAGGFVLQIGAYRTEETAATALRTLTGRSPTLSQLAHRVQMVDLGAEGIMYRLQAGSFADRPSAASACEALKAEGVECFVTDFTSSQSPASGQAALSPGG